MNVILRTVEDHVLDMAVKIIQAYFQQWLAVYEYQTLVNPLK